jgi:hypothetical protein
MKNHFSWKSTGKVFIKTPVRIEKAMVSNGGGSNRAIKKMFNAKRKEAH